MARYIVDGKEVSEAEFVAHLIEEGETIPRHLREVAEDQPEEFPRDMALDVAEEDEED